MQLKKRAEAVRTMDQLEQMMRRTTDTSILHFDYEIEGESASDKEWPHRFDDLTVEPVSNDAIDDVR